MKSVDTKKTINPLTMSIINTPLEQIEQKMSGQPGYLRTESRKAFHKTYLTVFMDSNHGMMLEFPGGFEIRSIVQSPAVNNEVLIHLVYVPEQVPEKKATRGPSKKAKAAGKLTPQPDTEKELEKTA